MNRLEKLFKDKKDILSIYFTAGYPKLDSTIEIIKELEYNKVDLIEIGMPYSDPIADGETIQHSNYIALKNGMNINLLLSQLSEIREKIYIPIILMGYFNPIYIYGIEKFLKEIKNIGIEGVIIPDLTPELYVNEYIDLFEKHKVQIIFLISPNTSIKRIEFIDSISKSFIYVVSNPIITGGSVDIDLLNNFLIKLNSLNLKSKKLVGFGIRNKDSFNKACEYSDGAIIGSEFIKCLLKSDNLNYSVKSFINSIRL